MQETLWKLELEFKELEEVYAEASIVWNDQVAQKAQQRYLDPLSVSSRNLLAALRQQRDYLDETNEISAVFAKTRIEFNQLSAEITGEVPSIEDLIKDTERCIDVATRYQRDFSNTISQVQSLFEKARQYES